MDVKQSIKIYRLSADNFDTSPFEALDMLHRRSQLEKKRDDMTQEEQQLLLDADRVLLKNAEKMHKHLSDVYEFNEEHTNKSFAEWWWHLDKVVKKDINVNLEDLLLMEIPDSERPIRELVEFRNEEAYHRFLKWSKEDQDVRLVDLRISKDVRKHAAILSRMKRIQKKVK